MGLASFIGGSVDDDDDESDLMMLICLGTNGAASPLFTFSIGRTGAGSFGVAVITRIVGGDV